MTPRNAPGAPLGPEEARLHDLANDVACEFVNQPGNRPHFVSDSARLVIAQVLGKQIEALLSRVAAEAEARGRESGARGDTLSRLRDSLAHMSAEDIDRLAALAESMSAARPSTARAGKRAIRAGQGKRGRKGKKHTPRRSQ